MPSTDCRKFKFSTALRAISLYAGLAGTAHAQEAYGPAGDQTIEGGEDMVVTGSRIGRPVLDLPTPVGVVTSDALEKNNAQFDIGRALAQQPSIGFSGSIDRKSVV